MFFDDIIMCARVHLDVLGRKARWCFDEKSVAAFSKLHWQKVPLQVCQVTTEHVSVNRGTMWSNRVMQNAPSH